MYKSTKSLVISIISIFLAGAAYAESNALNPRISVLTQVRASLTDDRASDNPNDILLKMGETEIVFDANLNPYSRGFFVFAICPVHGFETEEAYIIIHKGLPDGFSFRTGKSRVNFGALNLLHGHAYQFIETPQVLQSLLPGEESFNETLAELSYLLPVYESWAATISGGVLNGQSFHLDETKYASGWISRVSNSFLIDDNAPAEIGCSATQGTNNTLWKTKTSVYGADAKVKINFMPSTVLTLQGEYLYNAYDVVTDTTTGKYGALGRDGFYMFADINFNRRWNAGVIYNQYQREDNKNLTDRSVKAFGGYSLMEETTLFRLSYERFYPDGGEMNQTYMLQLVFSMGPHKPHQF